MTIYSVQKMWSRPNNGDARLTDNYRKVTLAFQECYQVFASADATQMDIFAASGIPAAGSPYPGFPSVFANAARPQKIAPLMWYCFVDYEGEAGITPDGGVSAPWDARPKIDYVARETEVEVDEDWDGNRITNVLGEALTARILKFERMAVVRRNMLFFNEAAFSVYDDAVNSDTFLGREPGTTRVRIEASNVYDKDFGYWEVTGYFIYKKPYRTTADKAWYSRIRNDGLYEYDPDFVGPGTRIIRACDDDNQPVTKAVQLDEFGYRLTDGTARWLEFKHFDSLPFSALGFGV